MSVIIRAMKMPKNCDECPLIAEADDYHVCYINEQFISWEWIDEHSAEQRHPRPSWCPLVELPPHGDLIDRDALKRKHKWTDDFYETEYVEVVDIDDAPAIIESEGEDG